MLAETVASWKDTWISEGRMEGFRKGFREGFMEGFREGRMEGHAEGRLDNLAENIRALMETLGLTKEKAMDMLKVFEEDRARLSRIL